VPAERALDRFADRAFGLGEAASARAASGSSFRATLSRVTASVPTRFAASSRPVVRAASTTAFAFASSSTSTMRMVRRSGVW